MNINQFRELIAQKKKELDDLMRRRMPVHAGRLAKDHYQENFRKGGFVNNGLHPWKKAKRLSSSGESAGDKYGTLLSARRHLFSSFKYSPHDWRVRVYNDVPYAPAHHFGETIKIPVTPQMRKFFWAKHYKEASNAEEPNKVDTMWKRMALRKKDTITVKMPKRPIIGSSAELTAKIQAKQETEIQKVLNS